MESVTYFQWTGEEAHWQRERSKNMWCKVTKTSERAEDPRPVLESRENKSSIEGLLGKATAATESRSSLGKGNDVKGKSSKGGRKKGKSKDAGALVWNQQTGSPVASSVASSELQTETSTTVGTIDTIECTALDLCATALTQQEIVNPRWIAFNEDTGAGGTVWPTNADYACEKISGPAGRNYKTATGENGRRTGMFPSSMSERLESPIADDWRIDVRSQTVVECWRRDRQKVARFGWMEMFGYIIQKDSPILRAMRMCFEKACEHHLWNGAIVVTKERGVYNFYVQGGRRRRQRGTSGCCHSQ